MGVNRREFLQRITMLSGFEASTAGLQMLGLAPMTANALPALSPEQGAGMQVAVLGAGIAGLVAAYQLERAGFKVTVLEARSRIGGGNWTLRPGSKIQMHGEAEQVADFSAGLYLNAGPSRIPSHHQGVVDYCRILGVPLEVMVNANRNALVSPQHAGSPPMQLRQAINDTRGRLAELLGTALNRGALDSELTDENKARLRYFLRVYGDLADDMTFQGSARSVGASHGGDPQKKLCGAVSSRTALTLRQMLTNDVLKATVYEEILGMQATMLQPVGGMDPLPAAFGRATQHLAADYVSLRLIGTARDKTSVLSFVLAGYQPTEVGEALNREGIAVRAGHHCAQPILRRFGLEATVRPSLAFYNTHEEVDRLVNTVRQLARK